MIHGVRATTNEHTANVNEGRQSYIYINFHNVLFTSVSHLFAIRLIYRNQEHRLSLMTKKIAEVVRTQSFLVPSSSDS